MRILYFHQYFLTPEQAGGTRSYEMAKRLVARGHQVTMVTSDYGLKPKPGKREVKVINGMRVIYLPVPYSNDMGFARRILAFGLFVLRSSQCALQEPCDIVFATSTPLTITVPGLIASTRRRVPYVFEVRDMWPDVPIAMGFLKNRLAQRFALWLEAVTYRRARHIVALAPGMKDEIVAKGIASSKISVIPNGCDVELFAAARDTGAEDLRKQLPESARGATLVVFAGMLGLANGVRYLADLAAAMSRLTPDVVFIVCGHGKDRDLLERQATTSGVMGKTFFMLGSTPKVDVARWMTIASASICLFSGPEVLFRNAVQNKFFDSLAAGLPVACNFIGWQTRIASEADVGVYLDPQDADLGAKALLDALSSPDWLGAARSKCLELATTRFNRDHLAEDLNRVLTDASLDQPST